MVLTCICTELKWKEFGLVEYRVFIFQLKIDVDEWKDSPDRQILEMGGVKTEHAERWSNQRTSRDL